MLALLLSATATAHDFEVGGIYYNINGTEATVTFKGTDSYTYSDEYSDDVTIPAMVTFGGTTYSVTSIGEGAFRDCSGLTSVTIPNSVTSIGILAFHSCSGLTSMTIPNSVTSIGFDAFWDCSGLTSVTIPNSVNSIKFGTFRGCSGLTSVTIPNSVTFIDVQAFDGCSSLTSVTIPNSVTSIGDQAFQGCNALDTVNFNAVSCADFSNTYTDGPFYNLNISTINIGDEVQKIPAYFACYITSLKSITIGNSVTSIGNCALLGCSGLTSVTIPNSVTAINFCAFDGCSSLTSVIIPNSVISIGYRAFESCRGLTSVTIGNSVTSIDRGAFWGCNALDTVNFNAVCCGDFSIIEDFHPFYNTNISTINIGDEVQKIPAYFAYGNHGLTSVTIPSSVISIGKYAFYGCSGLISVTCLATAPPTIGDNSSFAFSSDVTSQATLYVLEESVSAYQSAYNWKDFSRIVRISDTPAIDVFEVGGVWYRALDENTAMVIRRPEDNYQGDVVIPEAVTYEDFTFAVVGIDAGAFEDCYDLTSVVIGNAVEKIGENAFQGCTALTSVAIGSGVTVIGAKAFNYCNALTTVKCLGTVPPVMASADCFSTAAYNRATLIVPRQQIDSYGAVDYWYKFNHIEGWGSAGPGDVNGDGIIDINDITNLIYALLTGDKEAIYFESADMNYNGRLDIGDITTLIDYLLRGN